MEQKQSSQNGENQSEGDEVQSKVWSITGTAASIQIFLIALFLIGLGVHSYIPDPVEGPKAFLEAMFNLAIVIVVVVHAIIYYKQTEAMRAQLQATERQTKLVDKSIQSAEKNSIYANRAYVAAQVVDIGEREDVFKFYLRIENTGNSPANNVLVQFAVGLREEPPHKVTQPDNVVVFDIGFTEVKRFGLIAPRGSLPINTPDARLESRLDLEKWAINRLKFYCWGRISYEDIFNENRWTEFCFFQSQEHPYGYPCEHGNQAI